VAAVDGSLGEQVGVYRLGAGCCDDIVGGKETAAAEDEVVDQRADRRGLWGVGEPGGQRALVGGVVGPGAAHGKVDDGGCSRRPEHYVQILLITGLSDAASRLVGQVREQGTLVAIDADQVGLGFGGAVR